MLQLIFLRATLPLHWWSEKSAKPAVYAWNRLVFLSANNPHQNGQSLEWFPVVVTLKRRQDIWIICAGSNSTSLKGHIIVDQDKSCDVLVHLVSNSILRFWYLHKKWFIFPDRSRSWAQQARKPRSYASPKLCAASWWRGWSEELLA